MTRRLRSFIALATVVGTCTIAACHKDAAKLDEHARVFPSSPVPAPDGLVADVCARGPDALWGKLQQGVGGPLAHLPQSVGGILVTAAKLDLTLAGEVDGAAPAYGVVARPGPTSAWVAALKLRDFEHARTTLLEGKKPHFTGREGDGGLIVLGVPPGGAPGTPPPAYLVALSPLGYLVIARSEADLVTLAPYATRTLPTRPISAHALIVSISHTALAGSIHQALEAQLGDLRAAATMLDSSLRKQHGGKDPDLGDTTAVIQGLDDFARTKLALLADLDHAELDVDALEDDVDVELTLTPGMGPSAKSFAGFRTGDAAPLLSLSAETEAAILFQDDASSLNDAAKTAEDRTAAVLKSKLTDKDTAAIHGALAKWAGTRGPWMTVGVELGGGPALTLRTPSTDPDRAMQAVTNLIDLAHLPALRNVLEARFSVQGVSTATAAAPGFGSTSIATFRRAGPADGPEVAIAWAAAGDLLRVAAATSSARALRASKDPTSLLGSDVRLAGKLGTLRDRAAFVFAGRPSLGHEQDALRPSLVVALGREKANGWATLEIDDSMLRDGIVRWFDL